MIPIEKNIDNLHKVSIAVPNSGKMAEDIKSALLKAMLILGKDALGIAWVQLKRSLPYHSKLHLPKAIEKYKDGTHWRAFAIKLQNGTIKAFVNPIIRARYVGAGRQERTKHTEQCLSVKGKYKIGRYKEVMLFWSEPVIDYNKDKETLMFNSRLYPGLSEANQMLLTGRDAMVAQHEMDHLDGILISDRGKKVK